MQNRNRLSAEARARFSSSLAAAEKELEGVDRGDRLAFGLRLERWFENLLDGLAPVYGRQESFDGFIVELARHLARGWASRPSELKALDLERDLAPDWFQREHMLGYACYVDRFAGDLDGLHERLDYLEEVGATYVHLMSVLQPRNGENDGGYAIRDYRAVDPRIGTVDDLERVCAAFRARGISACVDLVLNHCADDHPWAQRARNGERRYREYFHVFLDRTEPDAFERTLPEVFPNFAPGNFTWDEGLGGWVWTTFHAYQWDLDWSNPQVFLEIVDILLYLANKGVEVFRLDAVAFMWKRLGTNCQNQPEVHDLLQALRACSRIAAPAVAHKAEAIVSPDDLIGYFGTGRRYGKVSNIAYHNALMVHFWSSLAARDTRLMTHALGRFPPTPPSIAWATYLRCHDDIGWAITDEDAAAVGLDGFRHRAFLSDYYAGSFAGSHARGVVFQHNPATGDRRISGSLASLVGLEEALALGEERRVALAIERILMGHALICGFGGIPLIWMGDEIALVNDYDYALEPEHAEDNRWIHRPRMDWDKAARRREPGSVEQRVFDGLRAIAAARARTPQLHAAYPNRIVDVGNPQVFAHVRVHPLGDLVALYNVSETYQEISLGRLRELGVVRPYDGLGQDFPEPVGASLRMTPYGRWWLM